MKKSEHGKGKADMKIPTMVAALYNTFKGSIVLSTVITKPSLLVVTMRGAFVWKRFRIYSYLYV